MSVKNQVDDSTLRVLVACDDCARQYDATQLSAGSQFHCLCGASIRVAPVAAHAAAVVRCSSCGGARLDKAPACSFCGSDFTLHEADMHTVCPECMARISDRARYCHYCATPIAPQSGVGEPTTRGCPACGEDHHLSSRRLTELPVATLECNACGGLWLNQKVFQLLEERAQTKAVSADTAAHKSLRGRPSSAPDPHGRYYRACPVCAVLMHRRNYGQRSGVLIDLCYEHGAWFDAGELDTILRWIRAGGLRDAEKWRKQNAAAQANTQQLLDNIDRTQQQRHANAYHEGRGSLGFIEGLIDYLL